MKNKLQKIIKHIKTMFYNLSLCVSLKKSSTNVEKNEKNSKFGYRYVFYKGEKIVLFNIDTMTVEEKNKKEKFILTFNEFIEKSSDNIWLSPDKISEITETNEKDVIKYVESFDEFVKNSEGKYTTKDEYFKYTPFIKRFKDLLNGTID
jgi:hypothetical protein